MIFSAGGRVTFRARSARWAILQPEIVEPCPLVEHTEERSSEDGDLAYAMGFSDHDGFVTLGVEVQLEGLDRTDLNRTPPSANTRRPSTAAASQP